MERTSGDGFAVHDDSQLTDFEPGKKLGELGKYPFNDGVYPRVMAGRSRIRRAVADGEKSAASYRGEYQPGTI